MQQVERGNLSLDDPLAKHLPSFKARLLRAADGDEPGSATDSRVIAQDSLTIRHCLNHTAGFSYHEVRLHTAPPPPPPL